MKPLVYLLSLLLSLPAVAQMCPGGGVVFSSAVTFDPNWIYGCNTGTSCNGGVNFSNQVSCQPSTAMDACAPSPSCGNIAQNGSNIWFKFYPLGPTATISCFQNTSLVIGIQAFSGGPACGSLTEIGCAVSAGPSSGVQLPLSGLLPGQLYYFRVFGSATPVSQRTGIYCFCGTAGLNNVVLPVAVESFKGFAAGDRVDLEWRTSQPGDCRYFEVQRSTDGRSFVDIGRVDGSAGIAGSFDYVDESWSASTNFYRLKLCTHDNDYTYSDVITINHQASDGFRVFFDAGRKELQFMAPRSTKVVIVNASGQLVKTVLLVEGRNTVAMADAAAGIYFVHDGGSHTTKRFFVFK